MYHNIEKEMCNAKYWNETENSPDAKKQLSTKFKSILLKDSRLIALKAKTCNRKIFKNFQKYNFNRAKK